MKRYRVIRFMFLVACVLHAGPGRAQLNAPETSEERDERLRRNQDQAFPQCRGSVGGYDHVGQRNHLRRLMSHLIGETVTAGSQQSNQRNVVVRAVTDGYVHIHLGEYQGREEHRCYTYGELPSDVIHYAESQWG